MPDAQPIRIAAALIDDGRGRTLLVRKAGTRWFMQAGGKIEAGEHPLDALCRELHEEIGFAIGHAAARHLGRFTAPAANEPGRSVDADLFHVRIAHDPAPGLEIAEAVWVDRATAAALPIAPLTREHILPCFLHWQRTRDARPGADRWLSCQIARVSPRRGGGAAVVGSSR